jgi:hypothetical protein
MAKTLTKTISNAYGPQDIEAQEKMKEIITEIERVGFDEQISQKSNLISDNVKGIVQIKVDNDYLYNRFGFRIGVRDQLVDAKLRTVKSRDGFGMMKLEALLKSLKSEMNMMPAPPMGALDAALSVRKNT